MTIQTFTKGDTEEVGDCGMWEAGIDHYTLDADQVVLVGVPYQIHGTPKKWYQRIVVYGNTAEQAEALRDKILEKLNNEDSVE